MPAMIQPSQYKKLPRHAKAFGKPIRLNHAGRRQVRATFYIRRYADSFKHKGLAGLDLAKAIVEDISKFEQVAVSHERAQALWARRSADNIIRTKKVIVVKYTKEDLGKHANIIQGCTDMTQAAVAGLRAAGFRVLIAREML
ncbi:MAG: hypothetical protein Q8N60_00855, partial [Candidatus Diapherotrites archaeon]|nr:hypothetical protein [Candidatus Diapherotrites archaeon]